MRLIGLLGAFTAQERERTRGACRERTNACRETMVACRERGRLHAGTGREKVIHARRKCRVHLKSRRTHAEEGRCMKEMTFVHAGRRGWGHAG